MIQEEIEKAAEEYSKGISNGKHYRDLIIGFIAGANFANKHWEEKTRWKSLEKEPPTEFGEGKRIFIKHKSLESNLYILYSDRSIEDALDMGFIEWKEID